MSTIICERCGKEFTRTSRSKICPECREAVGMTKKVLLDEKLKDLHEAGTTYGKAQMADTLASLPKIEVPEHLLRVETPEAPKLIAREAVDKERKNAAEAAWRFARAIIDLPGVLGDQLLALSYEDAVMEAKHLEAILADALGIK